MGSLTWIMLMFLSLKIAQASKRVVVFGGSGKTGIQTTKALIRTSEFDEIIVMARNKGKARRALGPDTGRMKILYTDVQKDSLNSFVKDADAVVNCMGYSGSPPNLLGPKLIDYEASKKLINACNKENVKRFVLVSSLLTNGLIAGQALNPQYLLLNAFGGILIWKREAEKYLESLSSHDNNTDDMTMTWTIIRPGGLKDEESNEPVLYAEPDTAFGGSISRKTLGEIVAKACTAEESANIIVETVQTKDAYEITPEEGFANIKSAIK